MTQAETRTDDAEQLRRIIDEIGPVALPSYATPVAPSQAQLDDLVERAQAIGDELAALFGTDRAHVVINVHDATAETYHAMPHEPQWFAEKGKGVRHAWRCVARAGGKYSLSRVDVTCAHDGRCPDVFDGQLQQQTREAAGNG